MASAVGPSPEKSINMESENIEMSEGRNLTVIDSILNSLSLLSSVDAPDQTSPGSTIEFSLDAEAQQSFDMDGTFNIVEIYKCQDSSCDNGELVEAQSEANSWDYTLEEGVGFNWNTEYTVPQEEGYYAATAYISDGQGTVYTDTPETKFIVGSVPSDEEPAEPNVEMYETPSFSKDDNTNTVTGTIGLKNTGDADMSDSNIVEMQVRPEGSGPLSFVSSQRVCDDEYPNNVNKKYDLDSGSFREIELEAGTDLQDGESYTVFFLTREACYPDNEPVEPIENSYNAGTFTFNDPQQDDGTEDGDSTEDGGTQSPDVNQVGKPSLSFDNGTVKGTITFENTGGDMTQEDIVEMQVRPQGAGPLSSAFGETVEVCDDNYPANVHRTFQLDSGEQATTTISTDAIEKGEKYTVFFLTRDGCYPDNERVEPIPQSIRGGTVDYTQDGSVGLPSTQSLLIVVLGLLAVVVVGGAVVFLT